MLVPATRSASGAVLGLLMFLLLPEGDGETRVTTTTWHDPIPPSCSQLPQQNLPGALCEGFDTDRNGNGVFDFTRLPLGADPNDPLRADGDLTDDVLGFAIGTGPSPLGTGSVTCAADFALTAGTRVSGGAKLRWRRRTTGTCTRRTKGREPATMRSTAPVSPPPKAEKPTEV